MEYDKSLISEVFLIMSSSFSSLANRFSMFDFSCVFVLPMASMATPTLSSVSFEYSAFQ